MQITLAEAISLITGHLMCPFERLHKLYDDLTGYALFTHQLPITAINIFPVAKAAWPELAAWLEGRQITRENWLLVLTEAAKVFPPQYEIQPLARRAEGGE